MIFKMISPLIICRASARNEANEDASKLSFFETKGAEKNNILLSKISIDHLRARSFASSLAV